MIQAMLGLTVFVGLAWLISEDRRKVSIRIVGVGVLVQFAMAVLLLKVPIFLHLFQKLNNVVAVLDQATRAGTSMVFGYIGSGPAPFEIEYPQHGFILGFQALPIILVMSALTALLFYWRILPWIVRGVSWLLRKSMNLSGVEGVGVSANVFVGMVESPLLIRPYIKNMTRSELFVVMTCGMATIAGTVMVLYANILADVIPNVMGHILTASLISVPAAVVIAKTMVPETDTPTSDKIHLSRDAVSSMDAVAKGAIQGLHIWLHVIAMLIVLVALVHLVNYLLGLLPAMGDEPVSLQRMFGVIMAPIAWLMGIPWTEAMPAGALLGVKTILNEFIAYLDMSRLPPDRLSEKSMLILTYAMCGFANLGSLGIMIGGMGAMAPERQEEIVRLGFRSIVAGTLATCMTGAILCIVVG